MRLSDLSGHRFTRLVAVSRVEGRAKTTWLCRCDCGEHVEVRRSNLISGNSKSCGCIVGKIACGWVNTPEYQAFKNAKNRCERAKDIRFLNYGGRGIKFRFKDMAEFIAAVGPRPSPDHSLDRKDLHGHYEAGNVRWATAKQQARNKTNNLMVMFRGETMPLKAACEAVGAPYKRAHARIRYQGWSVEMALS